MAFTQSDIDNLDNAIKEGVLEVQYADKKVRYQTMDDMVKARRLMQTEVNGPNRRTHTYARLERE